MLSQFNFNSTELRVVGTDIEPLFCLKDVCEILGISNIAQTAERIPESNLCKTDVRSGDQVRSFWFVNEPGLYQVIFRSNKPEAEKFRRWIFEEVLPSIRQTGKYELIPPSVINQPKPLEVDQALKLTEAIERLEDFADIQPRKAQILSDMLMNFVVEENRLPGTAEPRLRGVVEIAQDMGFNAVDAGTRTKLGRFIAKSSVGHLSRKEDRIVNGAMRRVNCFPDIPDVRMAISSFFQANPQKLLGE